MSHYLNKSLRYNTLMSAFVWIKKEVFFVPFSFAAMFTVAVDKVFLYLLILMADLISQILLSEFLFLLEISIKNKCAF